MIQKKERYRTYFMLLFDLAAALVSLPTGYELRMALYQHLSNLSPSAVNPALYSLQNYLWFYLITSSIILLFLLGNSGFKPVYRFRDLPGQAILLLEQLVLMAFSLGFISYLFKLEASRSLMLMYLCVLFGLMMATRIITVVYYRSVGMKNGERRVIVIGNSPRIYEIGENISQYADLGFAVVGYVTDSAAEEPRLEAQANPGRVILGPTDSVQQILEEHIVDEVVFASSGNDDLKLFEKIAMLCEEQGIPTRLSLDFFPHSISRTSLDFIENQPFLTFSPVPEQVFVLVVKRIVDIVGALFGILLSIPVFIVVPILIKLTSRGPVVYRQIRCGLYGRKFALFKFRSMIDGAEDVLWEIRHLNEMNGPTFKMRNDPRVTRLGRVLRKTSLDEIPQFFNVLKGDLSLVGPRAPLPEEVREYTRWQRRRLSVKPGITCLWQISGRNEIDFHEWMKLDLKYIDNWSLWLDLKILLLTIPTVLLCRGAR